MEGNSQDRPDTPASKRIKRLNEVASDTSVAQDRADGGELDSDDGAEIPWSRTPTPGIGALQPEDAVAVTTDSTSVERSSGAAPFVALEASVPTFKNLSNFFDVPPPPVLPRPSASKMHARKKRKRSAPEATLHDHFDGTDFDRVLIANREQLALCSEMTGGTTEFTFESRAQFRLRTGSMPSPDDMDSTCTLTMTEPGVLRPKPAVLAMFKSAMYDGTSSAFPGAEDRFKTLMTSLGQSTRTFDRREVTGLLTKEMASYPTDAGERNRYRAYIASSIAGQANRDLLIRISPGIYRSVYPKLFEGTRDSPSFEAVVRKYGKNDVWLKADDFSYMTYDKFNEYGNSMDAAEKQFARYMGRPYTPAVFIGVSDGRWLTTEKYYETPESRRDLSEIEALVLGKYDIGFLQPATMSKFEDSDDLYETRMKTAHLAGTVSYREGNGRWARVVWEPLPDILARQQTAIAGMFLVQINTDELLTTDTLPPGAKYRDIYPQKFNPEKTSYTGNFPRSMRSILRSAKFERNADGTTKQVVYSESGARYPNSMSTEQIAVFEAWQLSEDEREFAASPSAPSSSRNVRHSTLPSDSSDEEDSYPRRPTRSRRSISWDSSSSEEDAGGQPARATSSRFDRTSRDSSRG